METLRKDHNNEKESLDDHTMKLKEELRSIKAERNQLEMRTHALDAVSKIRQNLD